jgi:hypothetical protein
LAPVTVDKRKTNFELPVPGKRDCIFPCSCRHLTVGPGSYENSSSLILPSFNASATENKNKNRTVKSMEECDEEQNNFKHPMINKMEKEIATKPRSSNSERKEIRSQMKNLLCRLSTDYD